MSELKHSYSENIFGKKILIIGPYPPPLGGVSVHVSRVKEKFVSQKNIVHVYDTSKKYRNKIVALKNFITKIFITKPNIIYFHEPTESVQKFLSLILLKKILRYTLVTVDHDCRILYNFKPLPKNIFRFCIKKTDKAVIIGNTTEKCYLDNKVLPSKKTTVTQSPIFSIESPFLPPQKTLIPKLDPKTETFIKNRTPIISANAFIPCDLYGFDASVKLMQSLVKTYPNIGIIWGICKVETSEQKKYFCDTKKKISDLKLKKHFYFLIGQEFWPIIKKSDLFIRPTLSDSFGISIQEAISLKTLAIASDVCIRPEGTILFKTGNVEHLIEKTKKQLEAISTKM